MRIRSWRQVLHRPREHLLGSPARGNQSDANFDQAHVCFRARLHPVAVQRDLAAAAQRQPGGRDDDGHGRVLERHRGLLERAHHQVDFVPVALLRLEQQQHQVGAGREMLGVVANHQRREVCRGFLDRQLQHLDRVAADGVHLRVELDAEHAIAEIDQARARVPADDSVPIPGALEELKLARHG